MKIVTISMIAALFLLVATAGAAEKTAQKNIIETAIAAGNFNTLVEAVQVAGLEDTLKSPGPFTVFAPNDDAFFKMSKGETNALLENKTELTRILTYHVVLGTVMSSGLKDGISVKTVEGSNLKIKISDGTVMVNGAKVIKPDINASNGVIHVIDTVLMPPTAAEEMAAAVKAEAAAKENVAAAAKAETAAKENVATAAKAETAAKENVAAAAKAEQPKSQPGFDGIFAITGLLAVAFLVLGRRE
jgi:uncharacterized surface protein with fasciclin (FAS1) repeats